MTPGILYVQGDYNTETDLPAAVISDKTKFLSNGWRGRTLDGSPPFASDTAYNTAVLSNIVPTDRDADVFSGGVDGYFGLLENWSNRRFRIAGSFAALGSCRYAKGPWRYGRNHYVQPVYSVAYDEKFDSVDNLPPACPQATSIRRIVNYDPFAAD